MECPKCGYKPKSGETLTVQGTACVRGHSKVVGSKYLDGVDWKKIDSDNEGVLCPECGEWADIDNWGFEWV